MKKFILYKYMIVFVVLTSLALMSVGWWSGPELKATTIRASAALTTNYVASSIYVIDDSNQLNLGVAFTVGNSTGVVIKIEFSEDKTTWFQESYVTVADSLITHTPCTRKLTTTGSAIISIPVLATFYKVSSKALTSGTSTVLSIVAIRGGI